MGLPFDIINFDCYGTLVDWESGIVAAFSRVAAAEGIELRPADVLAIHAEVEPAVQAASPRNRFGRTNPPARTSRRRDAGSADVAGFTRPRAGSTTWSRRRPSGFPFSDGRIANLEELADWLA